MKEADWFTFWTIAVLSIIRTWVETIIEFKAVFFKFWLSEWSVSTFMKQVVQREVR